MTKLLITDLSKMTDYLKSKLIPLAAILILLGIVSTVFFSLEFVGNSTKLTKDPIDPAIWGQFGDIVGGFVGTIVALVGVLLLFETLRQQRQTYIKQQAETRFFELLKLHRENVSELNYTKFESGELRTGQHRKVFKAIFREFTECYREVKSFSDSENPDDYLKSTHKVKLLEIIKKNKLQIDIIEWVIIDISYCIIFYGVGQEGASILQDRFEKQYNDDYINPLLQYIKLKPKQEDKKRWDIWLKLNKNDINSLREIVQEFYVYKRNTTDSTASRLTTKSKFLDYKTEFYKYYGGHQHRLGHYFRHLFQSYKYLNYNENLNEDEKTFYGKTLRAQLSTYEQAVFFINSISNLGMKWELTPEDALIPKENKGKVNKENKIKSQLITRYHIIKNLPGDEISINNLLGNQIFRIKYSDYYPNVEYETNE